MKFWEIKGYLKTTQTIQRWRSSSIKSFRKQWMLGVDRLRHPHISSHWSLHSPSLCHRSRRIEVSRHWPTTFLSSLLRHFNWISLQALNKRFKNKLDQIHHVTLLIFHISICLRFTPTVCIRLSLRVRKEKKYSPLKRSQWINISYSRGNRKSQSSWPLVKSMQFIS